MYNIIVHCWQSVCPSSVLWSPIPPAAGTWSCKPPRAIAPHQLLEPRPPHPYVCTLWISLVPASWIPGSLVVSCNTHTDRLSDSWSLDPMGLCSTCPGPPGPPIANTQCSGLSNIQTKLRSDPVLGSQALYPTVLLVQPDIHLQLHTQMNTSTQYACTQLPEYVTGVSLSVTASLCSWRWASNHTACHTEILLCVVFFCVTVMCHSKI